MIEVTDKLLTNLVNDRKTKVIGHALNLNVEHKH